MSVHFQCHDRSVIKQALEREVFDLAVIGGGITGAGIARDAAMRGLKVALIEAQDFASGTSSRSSKMIHGGLRYLLKGDIPVVKESASERKIVHHIAPHLVEKSPFIVTTSSWIDEMVLRLALTVFEFLGGVDAQDRHVVWSHQELAKHEPSMSLKGLRGAVVYPEYLTDDARLTIANIRSAAEHGAVLTNYLKVIGIQKTDVFHLSCQTQLPDDNTSVTVKAASVVNAAGPWIDRVGQLESKEQISRLVLSRGIHVVVANARLPISNTVVMTTPDKRRIFAVPKGGFTYLGTTDDLYPETDYWPDVDGKDVDYLFETTNKLFNTPDLTSADIVSVWSGIRPLLVNAADPENQHKKSTEMSRKDEVWFGPLGILSIGGGKLSAYRAMAERIVDKVIATYQFKAGPCQTHVIPLPGGYCSEKNSSDLDQTTLSRWGAMYGSDLITISSMGTGLEAEVKFAVQYEGAMRLEDYWVRRSSRAWFDHSAGLACLRPAAIVMGVLLGWSKERIESEIAHCVAIDKQSKQFLAHEKRL